MNKNQKIIKSKSATAPLNEWLSEWTDEDQNNLEKVEWVDDSFFQIDML